MKKGFLAILIISMLVVIAGIFIYNYTKLSSQPANNQSSVTILNNVVDANNQFSLDLYSKYKTKEGNIFFSSYSISSALAMTYEGARGQTADEMQKVLHLPNDRQKIRSYFVSINNEINNINKSYKLTTANALWAQTDYPFKSDYLNLVNDYYSGKVTNLNFKDDAEKSRIIINKWVENKTNDKIKDLIPVGVITSITRLVLTNAIYFKANWSSQFDSESTTDGDFKLSSGTKISVKMMHTNNNFNYGETNRLQILEMNYLGNDLSMLIILPKENNLDNLESTFNMEKLNEWKDNMKSEEVRITFPKFKFETKYFMDKNLMDMGMPTAFNPNSADFTMIYNKTYTNENLYIYQVIHQAFVNVTESGTEAAAATAVIIAGTTGVETEPPRPKIFTADHPFIFIIQQKDTGNILFMGRVSDPSK